MECDKCREENCFDRKTKCPCPCHASPHGEGEETIEQGQVVWDSPWDSPAFWQRTYKVNYVQAAQIVSRIKRIVAAQRASAVKEVVEKVLANLPDDNCATCNMRTRNYIRSLEETR